MSRSACRCPPAANRLAPQRRPRQPAAVPEQLDVAVDGVTLQVSVWRNESPRPPVILLPATGETTEDWGAVALGLRASRTVYAVNLRGHGGSDWPGRYSIQAMADDVAGLLPHLGG